MKYLYVLLLFISVFAMACGSTSSKEPAAKEKGKGKGKGKSDGPVVVDVILATPQAISSTLEVNGSIIATESVELHPEISGRLTYLNIPEGSYVRKGTVLARINDADLRAQVGKIRVQLDLANQTVQRYKKLLDIGGINQADYDIALNQANSFKADINVLQAEIDKTVIRAPFNGTIGLRQTSPGGYVTPASILASMQQLGKVKVDFTVPEEYGNIVKKGDYVAVEVDAATRQRQRAHVIAIEPQVNTSTRNLLVRATLEGAANPGAFVKVYINAGSGKSSILVPGNAIIPEDINKTLVTVKNGKAVYVNVETGVRQASNVEVTKGVNAGDTIVVSGVLFTRPDSPVKIRSVKKLEELTM